MDGQTTTKTDYEIYRGLPGVEVLEDGVLSVPEGVYFRCGCGVICRRRPRVEDICERCWFEREFGPETQVEKGREAAA